ncbi:unnamed protein product [Caenorhabditis nigoni]|uniref:Uncharacterized protein n=1 Tax=Caenorhabditis nigoni TaxID=1611254 RepID=A0A2G5TDY1_9PELO|nr:hypothetical protein B9Z55_018345 [Caenorhabditis nigoni]
MKKTKQKRNSHIEMHYANFYCFQPSLLLPSYQKRIKAVQNFSRIIGNFYFSIFSHPTMNILGLLLFVLLAIAAPIVEAGRRCRSSTQCDYQSVCYNGYCYTIDEMFEKFDMKK